LLLLGGINTNNLMVQGCENNPMILPKLFPSPTEEFTYTNPDGIDAQVLKAYDERLRQTS
jgi:hypothetical protein